MAFAPTKPWKLPFITTWGGSPNRNLPTNSAEEAEKQLDFPALFIDRRDRGGTELQQIGQQDDLTLVFGIPNHDATQQVRVVGLGFDTGEADELVGADVAVLRDLAFLDHLKGGVILQAGDKEDPAHAPAGEKGVVDIAAINGHNRAGI